MLADNAHVSANQIRARFNRLVYQFENNDNYHYANDYSIPEDEDIAYEMLVHNKQYEALYYQYKQPINDEITDDMSMDEYMSILDNKLESINRCVWFRIEENNGKYYICMYYDNELNKANGEDL